MKEKSCPFCAGVDKEGIPVNCFMCRSNPKYLDARKKHLNKAPLHRGGGD